MNIQENETQSFVLYKKDGEWKISEKVYDSHSQN